MKTFILLFMIVIAASCNSRSENTDNNNASRNSEENVEENSGDNVSPQLQDSTDRFKVDSISSADEASEEKKNELEDGASTQ
jgi:hypothetical protein